MADETSVVAQIRVDYSCSAENLRHCVDRGVSAEKFLGIDSYTPVHLPLEIQDKTALLNRPQGRG